MLSVSECESHGLGVGVEPLGHYFRIELQGPGALQLKRVDLSSAFVVLLVHVVLTQPMAALLSAELVQLSKPALIKEISSPEWNVQIDSKSSKLAGYTALHMAIEYYRQNKPDDSMDTIKFLLGHGADGTILNSKNETALHMAFKKGLEDIVFIILTSNDSIPRNPMDNFGLTHFHIACSKNLPHIVTRFLEIGVDVNEPTDFFADIRINDENDTMIVGGFTPLHVAVWYRIEEVVDVLLRHGANTNVKDSRGLTPLHIACVGIFNERIVEQLLSLGRADPNMMNVMNQTPLHVLMRYGQVDMCSVETLLRYTTLVNTISFGWGKPSPIKYAFEMRNFDIIRTMIRKGSDLNEQLSEKAPNLLHLLFRGELHGSNNHLTRIEYLTIIDLLTEKGFDIDFQDEFGRRPIHEAIKEEDIEGVLALLISGTDINKFPGDYPTVFEGTWVEPVPDKMEYIKIILMKHVTIMKTLGFYVCSEVFHDYKLELERFPDKNFGSLELNSQQKMELEKMKRVFISREWTLYDFLKKKENEVALIVDKQVLREIMASDYICREYPELGCVLKLQFRKSLARKKLLDLSIEPLKLSIDALLPDLCWENVMKHLSDDDLRKIIEPSDEN
ncbi:hypothetical protein QAD02_019439 [Eretmocerus hayati]|uniref:Uncharacterized protein n=1 Tax=Eretmocerus hayati TaxID=131215 RepID=A0ACC2PJW0_9HYME|nr:hypothetical protein QAD02_019439 [Eretmocerus hayati]